MQQNQDGVRWKPNDGSSKDPEERASVGYHLLSDRLQYSFSQMGSQRVKETTDTSSCSFHLLSDVSSLGRGVSTVDSSFPFTPRVE
jgi:hypothetical protein